MNKIIPFVVALSYFPSAQCSVYKCVDNDGNTTFQGLPCADDGITSIEKIDVSTPNSSEQPQKITSEDKKPLRYFFLYDNMKLSVNTCVNRGSSYASEIKQAHDRFYQIGKREIEKGRQLFNRGFIGLSAQEMYERQRKAIANGKLKLNKMTLEDLNPLCDAQARKLREYAGQIPNRSSGYVEGDLDPEGND